MLSSLTLPAFATDPMMWVMGVALTLILIGPLRLAKYALIGVLIGLFGTAFTEGPSFELIATGFLFVAAALPRALVVSLGLVRDGLSEIVPDRPVNAPNHQGNDPIPMVDGGLNEFINPEPDVNPDNPLWEETLNNNEPDIDLETDTLDEFRT